MAEQFLYLPLYYARNKNYFGNIPNRYDVNIDLATPRTDERVFKSMMDTQGGANEHVHFAVCDPAQCFVYSKNGQPVLLASLVTNAAFWAVDRQRHSIRNYFDLAQYDKIISYRSENFKNEYSNSTRFFDYNAEGKITRIRSEFNVITEYIYNCNSKIIHVLNSQSSIGNYVYLYNDDGNNIIKKEHKDQHGIIDVIFNYSYN